MREGGFGEAVNHFSLRFVIGRFRIQYGEGRGAFQDPTHVSFWNSNSFWYYTRPEQARFIHSPVLFEANRVKNSFPADWHREHQIVYVKADLVKQ